METPQRVKSVAASLRALEDGRSGQDFGAVCESIQAKGEDEVGFPTKELSARALSQLTVKLLTFMEEQLGIDATPEQRGRMTKVPFRLFRQAEANGPLEVALCAVLRAKEERGLKKLDWSNADKAEELIEVLRTVERKLKESGYLPEYKIYITRAVPASLHPKLRAIVQKRGVVVSAASAATHIVYPDPDGTTADDTEGMEYCRTLSVRDSHALVHWWYFPDCYDSWIPADEVQGELEEEEAPTGPWHVQLRWLEDTEKFNDWMNEIDYEIPGELRTIVIPPPKSASTAKGKASEPATDTTTAASGARRSGRRGSTPLAPMDAAEVGPAGTVSATPSPGPDSTRRSRERNTFAVDARQDASRGNQNVEERRDGSMGETPASDLPDQASEGVSEDVSMSDTRDVHLSGGGLKVRLKLPREEQDAEKLGGPEKRPRLAKAGTDGETEQEIGQDGFGGGPAEGERRDGEDINMKPFDGKRRDVSSSGEEMMKASARAEPEQMDGAELLPMGDTKPNELAQAAVAADSALANGNVAAGQPATTGDVGAALPKVPVVIPAYSRWFRSDSVHDIERRALGEFFCGRYASKTERVYKEYRDFMIDTWRRRPDKYLTGTSVRRHLAGDVCAILRVHAFLEHWGLINHNVDPHTRPQPMVVQPPPPVPLAVQDATGFGNSTAVPKLLLFDDGGPVMKSGTSVMRKAPSLATRREVYAAAAAVDYHCDSCGADCSRMRFHCSTQADMDLCADCHAEGKYPPSISSRDFIQMTAVPHMEGYDASAWTETETLLLLEALELYQDNWDLVAEHVGSKSKDACVLQFLRLPIEDSFLTDQLGKVVPKTVPRDPSLSSAGVRDFTGQPLPFADASNPIMAQVAFLASMVPQDVALAATQSALEKLKEVSEVQDVKKSMSDAVAKGVGVTAASSALNQIEKEEAATIRDSGQPFGRDKSKAHAEEKGLECSDGNAVKAAAAVALAAAASRAKVLADEETVEINKLFTVIVQTKLDTLELKLKHFEMLEAHVRAERDRIERQRQQVYAERLSAAIASVTKRPVQDHSVLRAVPNGDPVLVDASSIRVKPVDMNAPAQFVAVNTSKKVGNPTASIAGQVKKTDVWDGNRTGVGPIGARNDLMNSKRQGPGQGAGQAPPTGAKAPMQAPRVNPPSTVPSQPRTQGAPSATQGVATHSGGFQQQSVHFQMQQQQLQGSQQGQPSPSVTQQQEMQQDQPPRQIPDQAQHFQMLQQQQGRAIVQQQMPPQVPQQMRMQPQMQPHLSSQPNAQVQQQMQQQMPPSMQPQMQLQAQQRQQQAQLQMQQQVQQQMLQQSQPHVQQQLQGPREP